MSKKDDGFAERQKRRSQQGEERGGQRKTALNTNIFKGEDGEGVTWYKPKKTKGKERNRIDILPWLISEDWYSGLKEFKGIPCEVEPGEMEYALIIPVHYDVGKNGDTVLCLSEAFGGECAICDEMFEKIKEDKVQHKEYISKLRAKWRCFYNVFDHEDEEFEGIKIWDMSFHLFEKYLRQESRDSDEGNVPFASLELGKVVTFKGREKSFGDRTFIEAESIDFEKRETDYDEDVMESTYKLDTALIIPDPVQVKNSFHQIEEDEDEEEDEDVKDGGKRTGRQKDELPDHSKGKECPEGFRFGIDTNKEDECEKCDEEVFKECCNEQEVLKKEEGEKEKSTTKEKKKKSFRR